MIDFSDRIQLHDKYEDSLKLKEFAYDNFKFDEHGVKLSNRVENAVGKGEIVITGKEIAQYE